MKRNSRKFVAILMALVLVFACSAVAFADNDTVTVIIDTRSYDLNGRLTTMNDQTTLPTIVSAVVSVYANDTAKDVITRALSQLSLNYSIDYGLYDWTDEDFGGEAFVQIGNVVDSGLNQTQKDNSFIWMDLPTYLDPQVIEHTSISGWVYSINTGSGADFYPTYYANRFPVSAGMTIKLRYSVTGPWDYDNQDWTYDGSNPDLVVWDLYDEAIALAEAYQDQDVMDYVLDELDSIFLNACAASANNASNLTGLTAYYWSHNGLSSVISDLEDLIGAL